MTRLTKLSRSIAGRAALVTGAASGMGRATAHLFADEGAHVAVTDVGRDAVERVVDEIRAAGGSARGFAMDVSDDAAVARVVPEIAAAFGRLDIVINNAGVIRFAKIDADDFMASWDSALSIMLTAHVRVVRAALPFLRKSDAGRIVNIASTEALGATKFGSPYTAAKTGVVGLTRALAVELGAEGITVNCICPGPIRTAMTAPIPEEHKAIFARRNVALGRYAEPEEVAHGTLNFCLPASQYITGATLPVDGGMTIKNA
ncbi:MAG: SDR family oxidoreductase [Deltaproteobacteria bacterium]|nr:SDR family oxidoreductase [Deltaproteobacteria bacterium]